jgi:hypothetical protein
MVFGIFLTLILMSGDEPEVWVWACSQYVGQLIYANIYGVTSAAYVLLTTLGNIKILSPDQYGFGSDSQASENLFLSGT